MRELTNDEQAQVGGGQSWSDYLAGLEDWTMLAYSGVVQGAVPWTAPAALAESFRLLGPGAGYAIY